MAHSNRWRCSIGYSPFAIRLSCPIPPAASCRDERRRTACTCARPRCCRRVGGGVPEPLARAKRPIIELAVVPDLEHHIAFELIEELFDRIVVIIGALVWSADHLHGHFPVFKDFLVPHRRLEQGLVFFDPVLEIECPQSCGRQGCSSHAFFPWVGRCSHAGMLFVTFPTANRVDPCSAHAGCVHHWRK